MKFLEKILPSFLTQSLLIYNFSVVFITVLLFMTFLLVGASVSVFIAFLIDSWLKKRGYNLEIGLFALILIMLIVVFIADFIFSIIFLISNIKKKLMEDLL